MGVPDHFTCLLKNLYAGQEITVRKGHGTMNWFKIWKGLHQSCIVSLCLFKIYSSNEMDETGAHYTEWSKPER